MPLPLVQWPGLGKVGAGGDEMRRPGILLAGALLPVATASADNERRVRREAKRQAHWVGQGG